MDQPANAVWDLDAEISARRLAPQPIRLGGRTYHVRRDLTARERQAFWQHIARDGGGVGDVDAFAILLGPAGGGRAAPGQYDTADAEQLVEFTRTLPHELDILVTRKVVIAAGLKTERDFPEPDGPAGGHGGGQDDGHDDGAGGGPGESTASSPG